MYECLFFVKDLTVGDSGKYFGRIAVCTVDQLHSRLRTLRLSPLAVTAYANVRAPPRTTQRWPRTSSGVTRTTLWCSIVRDWVAWPVSLAARTVQDRTEANDVFLDPVYQDTAASCRDGREPSSTWGYLGWIRALGDTNTW